MLLFRTFTYFMLIAATLCQVAVADWFFMPSTYSHSPVTGERVEQYAPIPPVVVYQRPDYTRSGYRQSRSTIRAGGSIDNYHIVEQFGETVRPYGEWLYPYRPYSTPYDAWGPPYGGVNGDYYGDAYLRSGDGGRYYDHRGRDDYRERGYRDREFHRDDYRRGDRDRFRDRDRYYEDSTRARSREYGRYNGLYDGRGIPGDDEHYLDQPRRLEQMNDRDFYSP